MTATSMLTNLVASSYLPPKAYFQGLRDTPSENIRPQVYLTFDDGPDVQSTPLILDQLDALDAKATFFVEGRKAEKNPDLIQRIYKSGHSIGTHSWSHNSAAEVSNKIWIEDVQRARFYVEQLLGVKCPLFRAPYGNYNPIVVAKLLLLDYRLIQWNRDTKDYQMDSDSDLIDWFSNCSLSKQSIVLMHDNHSPATYCLFDAVKRIANRTDLIAIPMTGV